MRGGHCLKVWTKKQQVISLSTAESELHAAVNRARGIGNSERGEGPGHCMWVEPTAECQGDDVFGQPQRAGQGKTRRHAECVDTRSLQVKEVFVTKKVGTNVNPADLMTKPQPGPKIVQLMKSTGYDFVGQSSRQESLYGLRLVGGLSDVKEKAESSGCHSEKRLSAAATAKRDLRKFTVAQLVLRRKA